MSEITPAIVLQQLTAAGFEIGKFDEEQVDEGQTIWHPTMYHLLTDSEASWTTFYAHKGSLYFMMYNNEYKVEMDDKMVANTIEFFMRLYTNNWMCLEYYMESYPCEKHMHKFLDDAHQHSAFVNGRKLEWEA